MTKKIIAILCIAMVTIWEGQSQTKFKQELAVGASFGVNFSSVSFSPRVKQSMLMGFNGGAVLRWNTESHMGIQTEINFTQQGWKEKYEEHPDYEYSRTLNYFEIPFFTHIYFGSKRVKVFINLGPKIGYEISESTQSNIQDVTFDSNVPTEQHALPVEKKLDWGLCGGPGLEFRTGIGYFLLEGRYYYALGDIYHSQKKDPFAKSAPQVISVKVSYLLPILK